MNRSLLTPRWLLLHVVFLAAFITTALLAWWQWGRAQDAGGSFQNLGYALQWPLFGAFTIFLWYRLASMTAREHPAGEDEQEAEVSPASSAATPARKRPLVPPPASPVTSDEDPELVEYNKYLAELNEAEQRPS